MHVILHDKQHNVIETINVYSHTQRNDVIMIERMNTQRQHITFENVCYTFTLFVVIAFALTIANAFDAMQMLFI